LLSGKNNVGDIRKKILINKYAISWLRVGAIIQHQQQWLLPGAITRTTMNGRREGTNNQKCYNQLSVRSGTEVATGREKFDRRGDNQLSVYCSAVALILAVDA